MTQLREELILSALVDAQLEWEHVTFTAILEALGYMKLECLMLCLSYRLQGCWRILHHEACGITLCLCREQVQLLHELLPLLKDRLVQLTETASILNQLCDHLLVSRTPTLCTLTLHSQFILQHVRCFFRKVLEQMYIMAEELLVILG